MNRREKVYTIEGVTMRLKTAKRHYQRSNIYSLLRFYSSYTKDLSRIKLGDSTTKRWTRTGRHYGYPKCCIKSFCTVDIENRTENQNIAAGNGFVPCDKCADLIVNGGKLVNEILVNRKHKLPFPLDY